MRMRSKRSPAPFPVPAHQMPFEEPEDSIQRSIVIAARYVLRPGVIMFHVPNGGKRSKAEAGRFKALGVLAGVADLQFLAEGRPYFIEVKTESGTQSAAQKDFHSACRQQGIPYVICRDVEGALKCLKDWGLTRTG